jgi:hypothetical protein
MSQSRTSEGRSGIDQSSPLGDLSDTDDVHTAVDGFIDKILDAANNEDTQTTVQEYLQALTTNGLSRYSLRNQIILFLQLQYRDEPFKSTAKHFAGYHTWMNDHNRYVEKGQQGFKLTAPRTGRLCPDCGNTPAYHKNNGWLECSLAGTSPKTWSFDPYEEWEEGVYDFGTATTFAYEQTSPLDDADPDEVFEPITEQYGADTGDCDVDGIFEALRCAATQGELTAEPITVEVKAPQSLNELKAGGSSRNGEIYIKDTGDKAQMLMTLIHEIAHEMNHWKEDEEDLPTPVEEVEAEAIAYAISSYVGLETTRSELYISGWVEHARQKSSEAEPEEDNEDVDHRRETARSVIRDRLEYVRKTSTAIIETIKDNRIDDPDQSSTEDSDDEVAKAA